MEHLKELLNKAKAKLLRQTDLKELAGKRWQANHDRAHTEHKKQKELEHEARLALKQHHKARAEDLVDAARRHSHRASKSHLRAVYWIGEAKRAEKHIAKLEDLINKRERRLKHLESQGCHRSGNLIVGGSNKANLEYAMLYSMKHGSQFYSQVGALDLKHGLSGPTRGHRHDCSSWDWSMLYAAGIADPTGGNYEQNVWTGNEAEHGEGISESQLDTGCDIFFGTAPFHHVEKKIGPMSESNRTVGHGSDPIDYGSTSLLPGPRAFRRYIK